MLFLPLGSWWSGFTSVEENATYWCVGCPLWDHLASDTGHHLHGGGMWQVVYNLFCGFPVLPLYCQWPLDQLCCWKCFYYLWQALLGWTEQVSQVHNFMALSPCHQWLPTPLYCLKCPTAYTRLGCNREEKSELPFSSAFLTLQEASARLL